MLFSSYMIHIYCLFHLNLDFLRIPISCIDINDAGTLPHRLHIGVFRISAANHMGGDGLGKQCFLLS